MPTFAAIDIGSNSVRLKISRLQAGRLKEVHEDREVTRLGNGVFSGGLLSPEAMSETVRVLRRFNRAVQECGTDQVKVVATAALRDARNSRAFLEWVRSTTGWTIEIVSGLEEARLIHLGMVSAVNRFKTGYLDGNPWANKLDVDVPLGLKILGHELHTGGFFSRTEVFGDAARGLNTEYVYTAKARLVLDFLGKLWKVKWLGLGVSYFWGHEFSGWSAGLDMRFQF